MRIVFDSNIYVSAFIFPDSRAADAISKVILSNDTLILSPAIIAEVLAVLASKFGRDKEGISRTAVFLADLGSIVNPEKRITVLNDDSDNRILECARAGMADAIVTGDKAILQLKEYEGTKILTLKEYLEH